MTGRYGTIGEVFFVGEDFWPLNTTLFVKDFKGSDQRFAYYLLKSLNFAAYNDKSSVPGVNRNHLHTMEVRIPTRLDEQRAIAHILGTLDDKIELNRRMNQTLDEMARALFKSWFVDFDPVRAKAEGRQPAGMDAETAALFPATFHSADRAPMPDGWRLGTVGHFVSIAKRTINPALFPDESFDHYSIPAFDNGRAPAVEHGSTIRSNKMLVAPDEILISKLNPHISRVRLPDVSSARCSVCSTEFLVLVPHRTGTRPFVYSLLISESFSHRFASLMTGTTGSHQRVRPEGLLAMTVGMPPDRIVDHFSEITKPRLDRVAANQRESLDLAQARDALLPKLLSGEIPIHPCPG